MWPELARGEAGNPLFGRSWREKKLVALGVAGAGRRGETEAAFVWPDGAGEEKKRQAKGSSSLETETALPIVQIWAAKHLFEGFGPLSGQGV